MGQINRTKKSEGLTDSQKYHINHAVQNIIFLDDTISSELQ
uniref:Uncharacterized protein n=1 Tax=Arundo donax TaxID=35708 RepID=A0A0A9CIA5_ARUDO